ncbi:MAG: hypothetical protein JXQ75_21895 [Phycisphaerae bacterium]|nr:hypothetical protein [Phycisphaerae bacterium]
MTKAIDKAGVLALAARGETVAPASRRWFSRSGTAFPNRCLPFYHGLLAAMFGGWLACAPAAEASETVYPSKDGALVDGGVYGPFDGIADSWDWSFDCSSFEGPVTMTTETPESSMEHRLVWEYDLSGVSIEPPVSAVLTFTIRGAPIRPFPDVDACVYSYPADLVESPDDYSAGPAVLQGCAAVVPYQPPTEYTVDVSRVVGEALLSGEDKVAFRFQVDPDSPDSSRQAFIDALDSDQTTKPYLTIADAGVLADMDCNGELDTNDISLFVEALLDPEYSGCDADRGDMNQDRSVNGRDIQLFCNAMLSQR